MGLLKLAWKNLIHNPLGLLLNLVLITLGVGLINFILSLNTQLVDKFDKNLAGVDLVIGAKGSPLQMILSSMYHIDAPTGNITIKEAKPFLREGHPLIKKSVPLSMGDSYKGYRIIGTDYTILDIYNAEIESGKKWKNIYEATVGAVAAEKLNLKLGSTFTSTHGFNDDDDMAHEHGVFKVVGILKPTGSVIDQLLLCNTESVWAVHNHVEGEDHAHDDHDHSHDDHDHAHDGHDHDHYDHQSDMSRAHLLTHEEEEITSILIQFQNRKNFQALNLPRNINENTDLQAASPAYEIPRLYDMMGQGTKALKLLAIIIAIVCAISIFVSMLNSLRQRKYELSLLRVFGGTPYGLFSLIIIEAIILAILGFLLGMLISNISFSAMAQGMTEKYNYQFSAWQVHGNELWIFGLTIGIAFLAALIPAMLAYNTDIHENLSEM